MKSKIKFLLCREVKPPKRAHATDAGIDVFVPKFNKEFLADLLEKNSWLCRNNELTPGTVYVSISDNKLKEKVEEKYIDKNIISFDTVLGKPYLILPPNKRILIPGGFRTRMEKPDRALIAANKSGVSTKKGLIFGAQVVDYSYKGEVHLSLINTSDRSERIYEDSKILQFLETPIFISDIEIDVETPIFKSELSVLDPINSEEFFKGIDDNRGTEGFGSTDKK